MADDATPAAKPKPRVNIRFLFAFCEAIPPMREFYSNLLGLQEYSHIDDGPMGWLAYKCEGFEFMVFRLTADEGDIPFQPLPDFAWQPGDGAGQRLFTNWGIEIPEEDYRATLEKLLAAKVPALSDKPTWRQDSYWGYTVRDPAGHTVEVFCHVKERPEKTEWE